MVAPTCMGEEGDQKPQLSCSMVAWQLLVHNMPEDKENNLDHDNRFIMNIFVCKLPMQTIFKWIKNQSRTNK